MFELLSTLALAHAFATADAPAGQNGWGTPSPDSGRHCVSGAVVDEYGNITPLECDELRIDPPDPLPSLY